MKAHGLKYIERGKDIGLKGRPRCLPTCWYKGLPCKMKYLVRLGFREQCCDRLGFAQIKLTVPDGWRDVFWQGRRQPAAPDLDIRLIQKVVCQMTTSKSVDAGYEGPQSVSPRLSSPYVINFSDAMALYLNWFLGSGLK